MFFIKEEQLCGYLPPLALFLYPVLRHYLRSNAGAAEVSEAQFLMVGAHCSPWLQNGLAYAGLAPLSWRGQLCESLSAVAPPCGVIILVIISFSNQGCHYFFVLTEFFFPVVLFYGGCELPCADNTLAWDLWMFTWIFMWKPVRRMNYSKGATLIKQSKAIFQLWNRNMKASYWYQVCSIIFTPVCFMWYLKLQSFVVYSFVH